MVDAVRTIGGLVITSSCGQVSRRFDEVHFPFIVRWPFCRLFVQAAFAVRTSDAKPSFFAVLIHSKMNTQNTVRFRDMPARYDGVSRLLHWLSLLLLVTQFSLGWLMPDSDSVKAPVGLVTWHVGIGTSLLAAFAARLVWVAMRRSSGPVDQQACFGFWRRGFTLRCSRFCCSFRCSDG